jgi:hypothetical protein
LWAITLNHLKPKSGAWVTILFRYGKN